MVARILEIRIGIGTVSNALEMSTAATIARGAGLLLLRPCRIFWERLVRRVVVECCDRNPCWVGLKVSSGVIVARTRRSRILETFEMRDTGR